MNLDDFLIKQNLIYQEIKQAGKSIATEGIKPDKAVLEQYGGLSVCFRHTSDITEKLQHFTTKISTVVPSVSFGVANAHTTISDYKILPHSNRSASDYLTDIKYLTWGIEEALKSTYAACSIDFERFLVNQTTIIVAGIPNQGFVDIVNEVRMCCGKYDIDLRMPWGAHMTAVRFKEAKTTEELGDFFEVMSKAPKLGISKPFAIDIVDYSINSKGVVFNTLKRFEL